MSKFPSNSQTKQDSQTATGSLPGRGKCFHTAWPGHVSEPWLLVYLHAQAGSVSS